MRKSLRGVVALAVSALALTSCLSKVSFADFQTGVKNAESSEYTKVKFSGKYNSTEFSGKELSWANGSISVSVDTETAAAIVFMSTVGNIGLYTAAENTNYTYYTGGGFKVEMSEKEYVEWNSAALFTKWTNGTDTLSASWSK